MFPNLKVHIGIHECKKSYMSSIRKASFKTHIQKSCVQLLLQINVDCERPFSRLATKSYKSVQFVILIVLKKGSLKAHVCQFMKTKSHICAQFAILFLLKSYLFENN